MFYSLCVCELVCVCVRLCLWVCSFSWSQKIFKKFPRKYSPCCMCLCMQTKKTLMCNGEKVFALQFSIICSPSLFFPPSFYLLYFPIPLPTHFKFPPSLSLTQFISLWKNTCSEMCGHVYLWLIVMQCRGRLLHKSPQLWLDLSVLQML